VTPYLQQRRDELRKVYRDGLLHDVIPFWLKHGMDRQHGGIFTALGRRGELLDSDKAVWFQGRAAWTFAHLYNTVEPRPEWLEAALSCGNFLHDRCADLTGKLHFTVTSEGDPLRMRRYVFSECFAAIAYGALHHATGQRQWKERAIAAFETFLKYNRTPGLIAPKTHPETRPMKGLSPLMMTIVTAQDLRADLGDITVMGQTLTQWVQAAIQEIRQDFMKPDLRAVMEVVGPRGEIYDHFDGRLLNPGHVMEAAWFMLREARYRPDPAVQQAGLQMIDWMWERGWDAEHGGLLYFVDVHRKPIQEYWHFMKFWWPHNETIIATLWAHIVTGDDKYAKMHQQVHDWTYAHFPDPEAGEWFGYLDRQGRPTSELKGTMWKGPFHLPRQQLVCWQLLENLV